MLTLFPGESIVSQSNGDAVVLTTHRICYEQKEWGKSYNQHIMLEHITSSEVHATSVMLFLVASIGCFLYAVLAGMNSSDLFSGAFLAGLVFGGLYWFTRKKQIVIGSPSTKMHINVSGMKKEMISHFVMMLEHTKNNRLIELSKRA
jgi:hypothetical protein